MLAVLALPILLLPVACGTVLGLILGLAVLLPALVGIRRAAALGAGREVGGRRLVVLADQHFCAVGQIGETGRHHAVGRRQSAGDDGIVFILLGHHHRLGGRDIIGPDHIAERAGGPALHRRRR